MPAAGFLSTLVDMAKFLAWQLRQREVGADETESAIFGATLKEMQRPKRMNSDLDFGHGYCFWIFPTDQGMLVGHGGQMPGFFSHSAIDIDNKIGIALMANTMRCPINPGESGSIMDALFSTVRTAIGNEQPKAPADPKWNAYYG